MLTVAQPSPAATAGLMVGDVITAFNGKDTATAEDFVAALRGVNPGDRVQLTVVRGGATQQLQVTVADRPAS